VTEFGEEGGWATSTSGDDPVEQRGPKHRNTEHGIPMFPLRRCWPKQDERSNEENEGRKNKKTAHDQTEPNNLALPSIEPLQVWIATKVPNCDQSDRQKQGKDQSTPKRRVGASTTQLLFLIPWSYQARHAWHFPPFDRSDLKASASDRISEPSPFDHLHRPG